MDCYRNLQDIKRAFLDFMDRVPFYGIVVACNDDPMLRRVLPKLKRRMVSYGTRQGSDFQIRLRSAGNSGKGTAPSRAATADPACTNRFPTAAALLATAAA